MNKFLIVWSHRHGTDVVLFKTKRELDLFATDEMAWEILRELGHDVEPEQGENIEAFCEITDHEFEILK